VIQALSSNRSDQSLEMGVLPRTPGCSQDFVHAHAFRHLAEFQPVRAVAIAQQIPRRMVPRKCLQKLSGGPFCGGVCGHRKMHQTSTVMARITNVNSSWNVMVGTTKKSMETKSLV
jgi:hypothetical protein